jgi:hypothetical protein
MPPRKVGARTHHPGALVEPRAAEIPQCSIVRGKLFFLNPRDINHIPVISRVKSREAA